MASSTRGRDGRRQTKKPVNPMKECQQGCPAPKRCVFRSATTQSRPPSTCVVGLAPEGTRMLLLMLQGQRWAEAHCSLPRVVLPLSIGCLAFEGSLPVTTALLQCQLVRGQRGGIIRLEGITKPSLPPHNITHLINGSALFANNKGCYPCSGLAVGHYTLFFYFE